MTASICAFCGTSAHLARRLVHSDDGAAAICAACIVRCTTILLGVSEPAAKARADGVRFPRLPMRSLDNFLAEADFWSRTHVPPDVHGFVHTFLRDYAGAVGGVANTPRHEAYEQPVAEAAIEQAFEAMMQPYRKEARRRYIGAIFTEVLGSSIRQAFRDHVALSRTPYGERAKTEARPR